MASHPRHALYLFSPEPEARPSSHISIALAESAREVAANFLWTVHHALRDPSKMPLAGTAVDRLVNFIRTAWAILQAQVSEFEVVVFGADAPLNPARGLKLVAEAERTHVSRLWLRPRDQVPPTMDRKYD